MQRINEVAVLDIGSEKLSVFVANRGINNIFNIKGIGEVDYAGFINGKWLDPDALKSSISNAIKIAESNSHTRIKKIFIGVPGEFTTVVTKEVSQGYDLRHRINDNDIDALFKKGDTFYDHSRYITVNCSAIYYMLDDNRRLIEPKGLISSKVKALISYILCEREFTDKLDIIMEDLGMREVEFISSAWAEGMYLFEAEQRDRAVLLVDVGHITTTVMLIRGDGLLHMVSFSCGGGNIAGDLNMYLDIPYLDAEQIKYKLNLNLSNGDDDAYSINTKKGKLSYPAREINNIVTARIEIIGNAINKAIEYNEYECPNYLPLYLTGGGLSNIRGAKEILSRIVARPVEVVAPQMPQINKPSLSSSMGMIDVAIKHQESSRGLLNKVFKKLISR